MLGKDKKCKADLVHKHVLVPQHMNIYTLIPLPISTFYSVSQSCLERYIALKIYQQSHDMTTLLTITITMHNVMNLNLYID